MSKSIYDQEYRMLIGALRDARKMADVTQHELAVRLGRPQSFIAKIEGCERRLDVVEFLRVCRALGVDPAVLIKSI